MNVCVRVQVAAHRRSGPTSPSGTQPLKPNSAPTAVAEPVDSPTSLADWFGPIAVTFAIVGVTTWLVLGAKRKRESQGLSAADATTLEDELEKVYGAHGPGRVGGLGDGPMVSRTAYLRVVAQWRQALPDVDFSAATVPTFSRQGGKSYHIKPGAVEFRMNDSERKTGMPRASCCSFDNLYAAAVAKAAEDVAKGQDSLVPKEFDLRRAAIKEFIVLAATVGVRRSCLEDNESSIRISLSQHMKRHREAADEGASNNRFARALLVNTPADVSARVLAAAAVAQAGNVPHLNRRRCSLLGCATRCVRSGRAQAGAGCLGRRGGGAARLASSTATVLAEPREWGGWRACV